MKDNYLRFFLDYRLLELFENVLNENKKLQKSSSFVIDDESIVLESTGNGLIALAKSNSETIIGHNRVMRTILEIILNLATSSPNIIWKFLTLEDRKEAQDGLIEFLIKNFRPDSTQYVNRMATDIMSMVLAPKVLLFQGLEKESNKKSCFELLLTEVVKRLADSKDMISQSVGSYIQLLVLVVQSDGLYNLVEISSKIWSGARFFEVLKQQLLHSKEKRVSLGCLSVITELIQFCTQAYEEEFKDLVHAVGLYLKNRKPGGMLLNASLRLLFELCRCGCSNLIIDLLNTLGNDLDSQRRLHKLAHPLKKYKEKLDDNWTNEELKRFFCHQELDDSMKRCTIDPELLGFLDENQSSPILVDLSEQDPLDSQPHKLLKIN